MQSSLFQNEKNFIVHYKTMKILKYWASLTMQQRHVWTAVIHHASVTGTDPWQYVEVQLAAGQRCTLILQLLSSDKTDHN